MKNMQKSDILNSKIWEAYASGSISPEVMAKITGMPLSTTSGSTGTGDTSQRKSSETQGNSKKTTSKPNGAAINYSASGFKNKSLDPNTYANVDEWAKKFKN